MNIDYLIKMANQIGDFFESQPDRQEALRALATHIKNGWEPRMRTALLAHIDTAGGAGLHEVVQEAVATHRALLG